MLPTLGRIGPFTLYTYTVLLDIGIATAFVWLWRRERKQEKDPQLIFDAGLWAVVSGVIGARLGYVIANWQYFGQHLGEAIAVWTGGLAGAGAIVGAVLGLVIFCTRRKIPFSPTFDALALPALLVAVFGWAGCAAAGCASGLEVSPGQVPFAVYWPDMYGIYALRWPVQIIGMLLSLFGLFALAGLPGAQQPAGQRGLLSIAIIVLGAFFVTWIRGDEMPTFGTWRLDAIVYGILFLLILIAAAVQWALADPSRAENTIAEPNVQSAQDS